MNENLKSSNQWKTTSTNDKEMDSIPKKDKYPMSTIREQSSNNDFQHICTTGASVVSTVIETDSSPKLQLISHKSENQVPDNIQ